MKKIVIITAILFVSFVAKAQEKKIIGIWQLTTVVEDGKTMDGFKTVFIFSEKGILNAARSETSEPEEVGTWKYNKKQKTIVMTSDFDRDFNGEATVVKVNKKILVYKKSGATLNFTKLEKLDLPPKIEHLTTIKPTLNFTYDDLLDEEGGFYYEEETAKLPWKITDVLSFLKDYKDIIYTATNFSGDLEPDSFLVSSRVTYNEVEQTIDIREYSFFQKDYIDMSENPISINDSENYQEHLYFFPKEKVDPFKVVGTEMIETPLGSFECTVVEGIGNFDNKIKYWMINNKPGVFAKIIIVKDEDPPFGYNNIYVLKEIK